MQKTALVMGFGVFLLLVSLANAWTYQGIEYENNQVLVFINREDGLSTSIGGAEADEEQQGANEPTSNYLLDSAASLVFPIDFQGKEIPIASGFGNRRMPSGRIQFHPAVDVPSPHGTSLRAPFAGKVERVGDEGKCGKHVILKSSDGIYRSVFCHMGSIAVTDGQDVTPGQVVGTVDNTGNSLGNHLHYKLEKKDSHGAFIPVDPIAEHRGRPTQFAPELLLADEQILAKAREAPNRCVSLSDLRGTIQACSRRYRINDNLLAAVMLQESGCSGGSVKPTAKNPTSSASGLMQLLRGTVQDLNNRRADGESLVDFDRDIFKPSINICLAAKLFRVLCTNNHICTPDGAVQAYHDGPGGYAAALRGGPRTAESLNYLPSIKRHYSDLTPNHWPLGLSEGT